MLLIVNAFLLVLVLDRAGKSVRYEENAREDAIFVLARHGITVEKGVLPKDIALSAMTVPSDPETESAHAAALVGGPVTARTDGTYAGPSGSTVRFYPDGAFSFSAPPGALPLAGQSPSQAALDFVKKLGLTGRVSALSADGTAVTVQTLWNDVPLFVPRATTVTVQDGALRSAEGYRLTGTPVLEANGEALGVVTVLLQFLDHVKATGLICSAITELTGGYTLTTVQGSQPRLVPTWHIVTDTGEYDMNALTGELN